ncbi:MAG: Stp1/IreP family PP2C-type Ser/Thr phosphatase [Erysipelotrichaceae bacterium]|nr:Stp1/IreP family PP2C-type Ser/Thr phosphatase [Erysipelotrichaceae bacterium]
MKGHDDMNIAGATDCGYIRSTNQDCYVIQRIEDAVLAVVCDGIGGARAGDVASSISCKLMDEAFVKKIRFLNNDDVRAWLNLAIAEVNQHIVSLSRHVEDYQGMGTTMVAVVFSKDGMIAANVGDSRIYGVNQQLVQLSDDHSLVNELVKLGKVKKEEASKHPNRNMLTNAIGIGMQIDIDIFDVDNDFDMILLCSDGVHGYIEESDILNTVHSNREVQEKVNVLIGLANNAGGYDNSTVILVDLRGDEHE